MKKDERRIYVKLLRKGGSPREDLQGRISKGGSPRARRGLAGLTEGSAIEIKWQTFVGNVIRINFL